MKTSATTLAGSLAGLIRRFRPGGWAEEWSADEPPLRSELLSVEQMASHGKALAASHSPGRKRIRDPLLTRLARNESVLHRARDLLIAAVLDKRPGTPAGEWLLDNFHLIEEQIRTARQHLPPDYSRELPRLGNGPSAGLPRVYDIALEAISHGDGQVDPETLGRFLTAYQSVTTLTLGELWAIPIMLRLALIENLRRVGTRIIAHRSGRDLAAVWAGHMSDAVQNDPKSLILVVADMARSNPAMTSSFVAEIARRLQGQSAAMTMPLHWIEQRLAELGLSIAQLVQAENQQQAADQVSISNSISSLRQHAATDWHDFVESMSATERILREDASGVYPRMDFATRDHYRHVVESLARRGGLTEERVAGLCVRLALDAAGKEGAASPPDGASGTGDHREAHVGHYLVGAGLAQLEAAAGARPRWSAATRCVGTRGAYLAFILLVTTALTAALLSHAAANGLPGWLAWPGALATALAMSQLAIAIANWLATLTLLPEPLPRLDYAKGLERASRTLVVIPTMLYTERNVEDLAESLEVRFLANRDAFLQFGLLTDFGDAPAAEMPEDAALLALACERITALNLKYHGAAPAGEGDPFFLFHRPRLWNAREGAWIGEERKRGKLAALNGLLLEGISAPFSRIVGDVQGLSGVRYVITLDTDTQLPRDSARRLVSTIAHPLNRALYDPARRRVTQGYGILQPRVAVSLPGASHSRYALLHGEDAGLDPYTRMTSDVYQDLFAEGSFTGKGIYDVAAFELALKDRLPENRILSHDLLEGCYARSGYASDVQFYEENPSRYSTDASRRHRWMRGDWQLAAWLLRRVPAGGPGVGARATEANPLSLLSQWKIFDNLRRSLVTPALTAILLAGWLALDQAWLWTAAALAVLWLPAFGMTAVELARKPAEAPFAQHLRIVLRSALARLAGFAFAVACMPFEAWLALDAVLRTLWRGLVTRRRMLEWTASARLDAACAADGRPGTPAIMRALWLAPLLAAGMAALLADLQPASLAPAAPVLLLWLACPLVVWWLGQPVAGTPASLDAEQTLFLRTIARRTWAFFDTFVSAEDHWLPPDNFQETRDKGLAHRTSPTNMGLSLLANLSAHDFGYITTTRLIQRTTDALATMRLLERHRGHFYNWYDTQTLKPLLPVYVSSVDSGNLAGHLVTLAPGLEGIARQPISGVRWLDGLEDTFLTLAGTPPTAAAGSLRKFQAHLDEARATPPAGLRDLHRCLERMAATAVRITRELGEAGGPEPYTWAQALERHCHELLGEIAWLAPWTVLAGTPPGSGELAQLERIPLLGELAGLERELQPAIAARLALTTSPAERAWLGAVANGLTQAAARGNERIKQLAGLAAQAAAMARMDYDFLYDEVRHLLAIGYHVTEHRRDPGCYDLLASEARFAVFVGIAQGKLPQESWFALGRSLINVGNGPTLLSWSGSMFEYLMPLIVMPTFDNTLLDESYRAAVRRQVEYGRERGVPWGMSESGYNAIDAAHNYQYRAFGVPGLGIRRGLSSDLVIAPYASALALMVAPDEACSNLQRLAAEGMLGRYGFYEAADYTASRLRRRETCAVVRSYMAHHQAMSLLAFSDLLLDRPMQRRFASDPLVRATILLLQERIPKANALYLTDREGADYRVSDEAQELPLRLFSTPDTRLPEVQLLSNGRYNVMVTNAGGGYSRWKDVAVTRWREDSTGDPWGTFCYLRDTGTGKVWSPSLQPTLRRMDAYEAVFTEQRVEFRCNDAEFDTQTEIVVSPEDDIEIRRVRVTNRTRTRRSIDATSYAEVVLAASSADDLHPAFSNLFIQTEIDAARGAILCTRRQRSSGEATIWMLHMMAVHGVADSQVSYETDRARFIGRGNAPVDPRALQAGVSLSGSQGSVLDPVVSVRRSVALDPMQTVTFDLVTGIGEDRAACLLLAEKYQDRRLADRAFEMAWTHSQVALRQINVTEADAQLYGRLAGSVIHANRSLRADAAVIAANRRGQSGLWGYAISGDLPIVLVQLKDPANIELARQMVQAHAYWRLKGLAVDLVIWNEERGSYRQALHEQIMGLIAAGQETSVIDRPGGIFVRSADQISNEDRILLQSVARVVLTDARGSLADQVKRIPPADLAMPKLVPGRARAPAPARLPGAPADAQRADLYLPNGTGGFTPDGREYVITTTHPQATPTPWVNVLANPRFGCVVSDSGSMYTWNENAHEFRLTPWSNDSVGDVSGEAFYLRDEETGHAWSPSGLPRRGTGPYVTRHGFGYSVFEHTEDGVASELTVFVSHDLPVKFAVLKVRNVSGRTRQLSATGYVEWVLGNSRHKSGMHVVTEIDTQGGALFARNAYNPEFGECVAFFDADDAARTVSGDRAEFIGRNRSLRDPAAMGRAHLSGRVGAALDPCAAIQVPFELADGATREVIFRMGTGQGKDDASSLVQRLRRSGTARDALAAVRAYWNHALGAVQVRTPERSLDVLCNGWLVYQTMGCRLWGRSGHYQSGGAFGFRDQLQDVMALVHTQPGLAREHLLRCASRQFLEGDVQHWWHPLAGRGVRTHCADDFLWLPLAACRYVRATGDTALLDEQVYFLDGRAVNPGEDSYYDLPQRSLESASVYQHCVRAILRGFRYGEHGLPLMGSGDWNDGMNLVGAGGRGESVWLGFFLHHVLQAFVPVARAHGDAAFAERCEAEALHLRENIEAHGWDGAWYRRAWFDDGTPLGSSVNEECSIDSVAQSWSVLSGVASPQRARTAMASLDERLVDRQHALVRLLAPPFDRCEPDPGYIRGYLPGVRENGGQYTHAAIWATMAFAELKDHGKAWELFRMINPLNHGSSPARSGIYMVEPYVVAADVYAVAPHTGRGGWTWYTGSAGWMYQLVTESLLGLRIEAGRLRIEPCLPADWPGFGMSYRFGATTYRLEVVVQPGSTLAPAMSLDGEPQPDGWITLRDDGTEHHAQLLLPGAPAAGEAATPQRLPVIAA